MLEIIVLNPEDAKIAEEAGADRVELISAPELGGLTPSYGMIKEVAQSVAIPVNVMIRPHARSFQYSVFELRVMEEDIVTAKALGVNGVVLGVLNENTGIDTDTLRLLLRRAEGLDVTFHRAIDETADLLQAVAVLKQFPQVRRVLTSGGAQGHIAEHKDLLRSMRDQAGRGLNIMLGGGMTPENVLGLMRLTGAQEVHFGTALRRGRSFNQPLDGEAVAGVVALLALLRRERMHLTL